MADDTLLNAGTGGNTLRTLEDGSSIHWPVGVVAYATTVGTPDVLSIPVAAALADNTANPTTLIQGSAILAFDGSTWDRVRGDSTDGLLVNLGTNNDVTVTNAGTFVVQEDGAALTALQIIDNPVFVDDAAFTLTSSSVMVAGAIRDDALTTLTAIEGDAVPLRVGSTGALWTEIEGTVTANPSDTLSTNNSTTTPLGISGNFTGTGDDCLNFAGVTVMIFADQDSATDGMTFEFSSDNSNWDDSYAFTLSASVARRFQFPVTARYFRVNYTNGGTGQGAFRLQTILHRHNLLTSIHRIEDNVATDRSATLVKSALIAQVNGSGDFIPIQATAGGILKIGGGVEIDTWSAGAITANPASGTIDTVTTVGTVSAVVPGTGASNLGKAEDSAHTSADVGVMSLAVRNDGGTALAGTDGDYIPLGTDSSGNLYVNVAAGSASGTEYTEDAAAPANPAGPAVALVRQDTPGTLTSTDGDIVAQRATNYGAAYVQILDSSGNFINSFGGSGGTSHADDAAFSIGSASSITPTGFLADETAPDPVDEGDVGVPRMTLSRKPYAVITDPTSENNAGVDASGHLQVDIAADSAGIGGGTQYTLGTDTYTETTTIGTVAGAVRNDTLATLVNTDNEIAPLQVDGNGALYVVVNGTANVTDPSIFVDNAAFTLSTDSVSMAGAIRDDALSALAAIESDAVPLRVDANGALWVIPSGDTTIADGGNKITVDWNGTDPPIGAGTEATALRVTVATDSTGVLSVDDNGAALTVDNGGTFAVQSASAGDVAHDAADSGNPVKIGAKAETALSGITLVADGDRTDLHAGVDGVQIIRNHANLEDIVQGNAINTDGASTSVISAAGAGIKQYLTSITLTNTSSTDTYCEIKSATTVRWTFPVPANGGVTHTWDPPLPPNAANEAWNFDMGAAVTTAYCSMVGFKSKV